MTEWSEKLPPRPWKAVAGMVQDADGNPVAFTALEKVEYMWATYEITKLLASAPDLRDKLTATEAALAQERAAREVETPLVQAALGLAVVYSHLDPEEWRNLARENVRRGVDSGAPYWEIAGLMEAVGRYEEWETKQEQAVLAYSPDPSSATG